MHVHILYLTVKAIECTYTDQLQLRCENNYIDVNYVANSVDVLYLVSEMIMSIAI